MLKGYANRTGPTPCHAESSSGARIDSSVSSGTGLSIISLEARRTLCGLDQSPEKGSGTHSLTTTLTLPAAFRCNIAILRGLLAALLCIMPPIARQDRTPGDVEQLTMYISVCVCGKHSV